MTMGRPRGYDIRDYDLQKMFDAGMSRKAMAAVYGCSPSTITVKMTEFGISKTRPRPNIDAAIAKWKSQHVQA